MSQGLFGLITQLRHFFAGMGLASREPGHAEGEGIKSINWLSKGLDRAKDGLRSYGTICARIGWTAAYSMLESLATPQRSKIHEAARQLLSRCRGNHAEYSQVQERLSPISNVLGREFWQPLGNDLVEALAREAAARLVTSAPAVDNTPVFGGQREPGPLAAGADGTTTGAPGTSGHDAGSTAGASTSAAPGSGTEEPHDREASSTAAPET
ncbi:hypothetical protein PR202_gb29321 [Eleusine coracana subsp. coracana]|uniref:Uncharacterized protein n=1 Tax=Eleusine coracana subsp. coracana TaxID=191504 RepID=A0AAV5FZ49_ELECO|nr:hypothetical protein PR202_gb29321 [Eleusine coracana subsp. coracana]